MVAEKSDTQSKLFTSIQLVGGGAQLKGLPDFLEDRVLRALPPHSSISSVEVLPAKTAPSIVAWKGGAILGVLDFARDAWILGEDFREGGVRVSAGRKYHNSATWQTQMFWYNAVVD